MTDAPSPTQKQAVLPTSFALIVLCPILVFCLAEVILATLAHNSVPFSPELLELLEGRDFPEPGEAAARLHMIGLALLVLLGAAGMVLKTAFDFVAYFSGPARCTLVLASLLAVAVGMAFLGLWTLDWVLMPEDRIMDPKARLGVALFDRLFVGVNAIEKPRLWSQGTYKVLAGATHVAVVLAIAAMVTGSISCLAKFPDLDEKENWKLQSQRLKTYATISAAFLIVSVFYFKGWAVYPAFLLATEATNAAHAQFAALANAYTAFTGIEYSLVLAAYALPVSYFQSHEADLMARELIARSRGPKAAPPAAKLAAQVKSVRHREGLETTPLDMFKIILAIISPLITGALANLAAVVG